MPATTVTNGDTRIHVQVHGSGPVILCVHGWPEHAHSWRHQIKAFTELGYTVAAMDVRGYGLSSKPHDIAAYSLKNLAGDVAAVAQALSDQPVILFGHDWGAPIVYSTALWFAPQVSAVAGLSVPFLPASEQANPDLWATVYADHFFYQNYFQTEGAVEAEVEQDLPTALRKIYFALSGDAPVEEWLKTKPKDAGLLDDLIDPQPFPSWLAPVDLDVYVQAFRAGGFRGPINRYRAGAIDLADQIPLHGRLLAQPACFIAGEKDAVRHFFPGADLYADPGAGCADFRGTTLIPGIGHWVQQEAPDATNNALRKFVLGL